MRLIDADWLQERLAKEPMENRTYLRANEIAAEAPTAYDVDKVVEQLEQQKNQYFSRAEEIKNKFGENYESQKNYGKACSYDHAIEIVKSTGIE